MKTIKTIIVLLAAALLAWALPWCYAFVCSEPQESPLTLYSCVTHDFATFSFEGHDDAAGYDPAGNPYTERQFDSIMPTVFTRRLAEEGRLPERIDGIPFDAREVELSNFVFRASPSELNRPQIGSGPRRIPNARRRIPHHGAGNRIRENGRQPDRCRKERTFRSRDEEEGIRLSRPPYRGKRFDLQTLRQRLPVARRDRNAVPDETALRPAVRPPNGPIQ